MPIIRGTAPCHVPLSRFSSRQMFPNLSSSRLNSDTFLPVRSQVWLLDQFGVLHDGQKAYPGAVDAREHSHSFLDLLMQAWMNESCVLSNARQVSLFKSYRNSFLTILLMRPAACLPISAVQNLARSGAKLVLISNSSKRSKVTIDKLPGLGYDPTLFSADVTSGELTHQNLARSDQHN